MKLQDILLMRQEILLTLTILFILLGEVFRTDRQLKTFLQIYVGVFALVTLIGCP